PGPVPGKYEPIRKVVPDRLTPFGIKALRGTPLKAVEISERFQLPSTLRFAHELLFLNHGKSHKPLMTSLWVRSRPVGPNSLRKLFRSVVVAPSPRVSLPKALNRDKVRSEEHTSELQSPYDL